MGDGCIDRCSGYVRAPIEIMGIALEDEEKSNKPHNSKRAPYHWTDHVSFIKCGKLRIIRDVHLNLL